MEKVQITDLDMPFFSMVQLFIKMWAATFLAWMICTLVGSIVLAIPVIAFAAAAAKQ